MYFFRLAIIVIIIFVSLKLYNTINNIEIQPSDAIVDDNKQEQVENRSAHLQEEKKEMDSMMKEISTSEAQVLMHLSERHKELKTFEAELHDKEILLEATKQHVEMKVIQLEELQSNMKSLLNAYHKAEEEKIRSLVKIYENMRAQDAAQIFDDLDITTVLQVIDRMKEAKVAALLAKMRPEKARQITIKFADNYGKLDPKNYNLCLCK